MTRKVIIRPEAQRDLAEAFAWYEDRRQGLGADLMLSVEAMLEAIEQRPESFPVVHRGVRRALLKRFPYGIYFVSEMDFIRIVAIFHARRDPRSWQQRIGG